MGCNSSVPADHERGEISASARPQRPLSYSASAPVGGSVAVSKQEKCESSSSDLSSPNTDKKRKNSLKVRQHARVLSRNGSALRTEDVMLRRVKARRAVVHVRLRSVAGKSSMRSILKQAPAKYDKSTADKAFLIKHLEKCYLFQDSYSSVDSSHVENLVNTFNAVNVKKGDIVLGNDGRGRDCFFLVAQGKFTATSKEGKISELDVGSFFNVNGLLYDAGVDYTVQCVDLEGSLWCMQREDYRLLIAIGEDKRRLEFQSAVSGVPLLSDNLSEEQLAKVIESLLLVQFKVGERIMSKGENGNIMYFIKEGSVKCQGFGPDGKGYAELGPGSFFGEGSLLTNKPRNADVTAIAPTMCMALERSVFDAALGPLRGIIDAKFQARIIETIPIFKDLPSETRDRIARNTISETYNNGQLIVKQGGTDTDLYIIKAGNIAVYRNEEPENILATLKAGQWFGEMSLLKGEKRTANCVAVGGEVAECYKLTKENYETLISRNERASTMLEASTKSREEQNRQIRSHSRTLSLRDLKLIRIIGQGTFGTVYLSKLKGKKGVCALKKMSKQFIVQKKQTKTILMENLICKELHHPFVLTLISSFQDPDSLYMLFEYVPGGELFSLIDDSGYLPPLTACFYEMCLIETLDYLHNTIGVIYRDLKPENILVDAQGYFKLIDFGFAKRISPLAKTYTLCGTPEYLAPEIVLGKGHNRPVDYWAAGVLLYEMLVGFSPFSDEGDVPHRVICSNIVTMEPNYEYFDEIFPGKSNLKAKKACVHFLRSLLVKSPHKRLGSLSGGIRDLKDHQLFRLVVGSKYSFGDRLVGKKDKAPWLPKLKGDSDSSRFDTYDSADGKSPAYKGPQRFFANF